MVHEPLGLLPHCKACLAFGPSALIRASSLRQADTHFLRNASVNPAFHAHVHVLLPYCSSDLWQGNATHATSTQTWHFRGAAILQALVTGVLAPARPREVVLAGDSAGGLGAMGHLNRVAAALPDSSIVGLTDSAWLPRFEPLDLALLRGAQRFWDAVYDPVCGGALGPNAFMCAQLPILHPYLRRPTLHVVPLYDTFLAFGTADAPPASGNASATRTLALWGGAARDALRAVPGAGNVSYFAVACAWHVLLRPVTDLPPYYARLTEALRVYETITAQGEALQTVLQSWRMVWALPQTQAIDW